MKYSNIYKHIRLRLYFSLLYIIFLSHFGLFAQSAKSDSLYAKGVEFYNQENFPEALRFFEQSHALDIIEIDSLSCRQGYSASWLASCYYKMGDIENALKYDRFQFRFSPLDRRKTLEADSIQDSLIPDMENSQFSSALYKLKRLSIVEHQLYNEDHYAHIQTYRWIGACHLNMQNIDEALPCLEEALRLERLNYGETDTIQIQDITLLINVYTNTMRFERAAQLVDRLEAIVNYNFEKNQPINLDVKFYRIALCLMQRKWYDAKEILPDFISSVNDCLYPDFDKMEQALMAMHTMLSNCGRTDECITIGEAIRKLDSKKNSNDSFYLSIMKFYNTLNNKNYSDAEYLLQELEDLDKRLPEENRTNRIAALEFLKCYLYIATNRIEQAKDIFLRLENSQCSDVFENDVVLNPLYLTAKSTICAVLSDYEGASDAVDKLASYMDSTYVQKNLNLHAYQACYKAMSGKYLLARQMTKETIKNYKSDVIEKNAIYRIEKDTTEINGVIRLFDTYIKSSENMPDSVVYTLRDLKGDYLLLKVDLLKKLDKYQIDYEYYDCISDYAYELIRMKKYPEAQIVMDSYIKDWYDEFNKINPDSNDENEQLDRIMALLTIEEALYFRCENCYEKGDPEGIKAYDDLLRFVKYNSSDNANSDDYRQAMIQYYKYTDNKLGLLEYMRDIAISDADKINEANIRCLAECLENNGEYDEANTYWKKLITKLMLDSSSISKNEDEIFRTLSKVIKNQVYQLKDTVPVLDYMEKEIWTALDRSGDNHYRLFIKSINCLSYDIDDDSFIPYVEKEISRHNNFHTTPYHTACIYQSIAGVLFCGERNKKLALHYIRRARELVKDDETLSLLFGCYEYRILNEIILSHDSEKLDLGKSLLEKMYNNVLFTESTEYAELAERHMSTLISQRKFSKAKELGHKYFLHRSHTDEISLPHLFNKEHPLYSEFNFLNDSPLRDFSVLTDSYMRHNFYTALVQEEDPLALSYAIKVVNDEYNKLNTSMEINSVHASECDDLISLTSKMAFRHQTDSLKMYAYNTALFCKGLQLRSSNAIHAIIKRSGHKGALRKFDELQVVMRKLSNANESERDSLFKKRDYLEKDLCRLSNYFGDYKREINTSWKDVQNSLQQRDLAIELTCAYKKYSDDVSYKYGYFACILNKHMNAPEIVFLCDMDSLSSDIDIYDTTILSNKLLSALNPYLEGIRNIYYSPIGEFNKIALESLPLTSKGNKTFASKYNLYRVSSTSEIIGKSFHIDGANAVVYGGIRYDATIDEMVSDSQKYNVDRAITSGCEFSVDIDNLRGSVRKIPYLAGTKIEAENIVRTINSSSNNLTADAFLDLNGTETSFKNLDGQQKKIIHIATHGFYIDGNSLMHTQDSKSYSGIKGEDKSLMKSGLLFAGASNIYGGKNVPMDIDDGILTSHEIANMDLAGLDLCVLSACQTAQGEISSEGVFGLQRGFKKAGANSILMSLWQVDDEATCFLMTEFYKYWIHQNKSKYEALELAKKAVRSKSDKGWDSPKFWAAFILLDSVDKVLN